VILHLVLFTPRADLPVDEHKAFGDALAHALGSIPSVRGYRVGRRFRTGADYDALPGAFEYCGVIEFDDRAGLQEYLQHPAHQALGRLFYTTASSAFAGDFDAVDASPAAALGRWSAEDGQRIGRV
jgi:hypothetical protein